MIDMTGQKQLISIVMEFSQFFSINKTFTHILRLNCNIIQVIIL
ncbi:unnamed protein product [Paramecium octaurelia]|uniref:Uncharacterized protein n=1 Tax=Paramecium octaurelia TaxID=43137 RepID=A0A8S1W715_PAROT|nr:unnamed protein product [Paramecium octaurelia]CAD8184601.1 unnamed protein product [Paramecium octaurelia]